MASDDSIMIVALKKASALPRDQKRIAWDRYLLLIDGPRVREHRKVRVSQVLREVCPGCDNEWSG